MFSDFFKKRKLKKLTAKLSKTHPELFDKTGNTYNAGNFESSLDSVILNDEDVSFFPNSESVFYNLTKTERDFLLPLCSFQLNAINTSWNGTANFIFYQKSQAENIDSKFFLNDYGDYNVTIFKADDEKISFTGCSEVFQHDDNEKEFWIRAKTEYAYSKEQFQTNPAEFVSDRLKISGPLIRQLNSTPKWIQSDETPRSISSEKIYFIGQLNINSFLKNIGGWIFLFYCPEKKIFIQVEQWS